MPTKKLTNDLNTCTTSEATPLTSYFQAGSLGGKEKLHGEGSDAYRVVFMTKSGLGAGTNNWKLGEANGLEIGTRKWIRNARLYFMISDAESTTPHSYQIRSAAVADPVKDWEMGFFNWTKFGRHHSLTWHGSSPNNGHVTSKQKLGSNTGWHSMSLKSALRDLIRDYENDDYGLNYSKIGFSLEAVDEDQVAGNLLRMPDHGESDKPYMRISYGQPTLSRTRGFGKRMMARL
jgi:hypothetical protein